MIEENIEKTLMKTVKESIGCEPLTIKFKKLDERAVVPKYAHDGDVGMDLVAIDVEYDEEKDLYIYHTGLAFESEYHYGQFLFPRSSNRKTDAYLCNSVGIADSAIYRGEIMLCFKNRDSIQTIAELEAIKERDEFIINSTDFAIPFRTTYLNSMCVYRDKKKEVLEDAKKLKYAPYKVGDKVAQMVFVRYPNVKLEEAEELSDTERGSGGFGSTGN